MELKKQEKPPLTIKRYVDHLGIGDKYKKWEESNNSLESPEFNIEWVKNLDPKLRHIKYSESDGAKQFLQSIKSATESNVMDIFTNNYAHFCFYSYAFSNNDRHLVKQVLYKILLSEEIKK